MTRLLRSALRDAAAQAAETGARVRVTMPDDLIMAVTGHRSRRMVEKYAGAARQKVRAIEAQKRRK